MNPLVFLINILFQLYAAALLIRLLLQWVRADFYNPASQLIIKITDPVVKPLRRIIPGFAGIDMATLLLAFLVVVLKNILLLQQLNPLAIGLLSLGDTCAQLGEPRPIPPHDEPVKQPDKPHTQAC